MQVRAVLFDFDGLLVDTETAAFDAWQRIFEEHGQMLSIDEWLPNVGVDPEPFDPRARLEGLVGRSLSWSELDERRRVFRVAATSCCAGVRRILSEAADRGLRTGMVTNSAWSWVAEQLELVGLAPRLDCMVTRDDQQAPKPAPDAYQLALQRLGVDPESTIAFEDSPSGIAAAQAAGIWCVAVPNQLTRRLPLTRADQMVATLDDVSLSCLDERRRN